jgi:hypothetical protein
MRAMLYDWMSTLAEGAETSACAEISSWTVDSIPSRHACSNAEAPCTHHGRDALLSPTKNTPL